MRKPGKSINPGYIWGRLTKVRMSLGVPFLPQRHVPQTGSRIYYSL